MNSSVTSEDRFTHVQEEQDVHDEQEREISLGTSTILGIFFALALLCAVFFGFGYTLGRRSPQTVSASAAPAAPVIFTGGAKPAPGSPASHAASPNSGTDSTSDVGPEPQDAPVSPDTVVVLASSAAKTAASPSLHQPAPHALASQSPPPPATLDPPPSGAQTIVQITALTRQDDADNLAAALRKQGYDVGIRHEPQDKLLHVQIGPLPSKKDAEAMRQRLLAQGYHAILKDPSAASPQAAPRR